MRPLNPIPWSRLGIDLRQPQISRFQADEKLLHLQRSESALCFAVRGLPWAAFTVALALVVAPAGGAGHGTIVDVALKRPVGTISLDVALCCRATVSTALPNAPRFVRTA